MAIEVNPNYPSDLDSSIPTNSDLKAEGDDNLRNLKRVLKTTLPNVNGAINATQTELNYMVGATSAIQTQINAANALITSTAFSTALPTQTGHAGGVPTTNGTVASWADLATQAEMEAGVVTATRAMTPQRVAQAVVALAPASGLKLLATLTPTAAANLDFLTAFSATYDNYLIQIDGVNFSVSANDTLWLRFANAGVVDAGTNYFVATTGTTSFAVGASGQSTGNGVSGYINVFNVNSASGCKTINAVTQAQTSGSPGWTAFTGNAAYSAASTVSGFRLLWSVGSSFTAVGKVRVYGYSNI